MATLARVHDTAEGAESQLSARPRLDANLGAEETIR
jgi:hypothetical protein